MKKVGVKMISVSILSVKNDYKKAVERINNTDCEYLHLDIMDNTFTSSSSFTYEESKEINKINNKKLDINLLNNNIDEVLDDYIKLKPDIISFHYEAVENPEKYIKKIKKNNIMVGLAINPDTLVSEIYEYLDKIDVVLVMSVVPGKGGQKFIDSTIDKLKSLYKLKNNYNFLIEIDGGINNKVINNVKEYADIIVSGSFITNSNNYQEKINELNI